MKMLERGSSVRSRVAPLPLATVTLGHALLLALLLAAPDPTERITPPQPLMLSLVDLSTPEPVAPADPRPNPAPAKPRVEPPIPSPLKAPEHVAAEAQPTAEPAPPEPAPPEPSELPESAAQPEPVPVAQPVRPVVPSPAIAAAPAQPEPPPTPPRAAAYLSNPEPSYPALSRRLGEEGIVRLDILVNPDGTVARLELARSSGFPRLDRSAMATVQASWKFEPARRDGKPVAAWVTVPIRFTLRS